MEVGLLDRLNEIEEGLSKRLCSLTGGSYSDRTKSPLHKNIARGLGFASDLKVVLASFGVDVPLKAPTEDDYLNGDWITTIGKDIAEPPKNLLRENVKARLRGRPHEHGHVDSYNAGVKAGWLPKALSFPMLYASGVIYHNEAGEAFVGKEEADQYALTAFVDKFFTGRLDPEDTIISPLVSAYNLLAIGTTTARAIFSSHYLTLKDDGYPNTRVARATADYLENFAADVKGRVSW